ncbi:MAG: 2-dehydro-3-deoxygalactonokinase [Pseudomonadota bacterium]
MSAFCAAIDWGTSSFRIWMIAEDGTVMAERRSDEGMNTAAHSGFAPIMEAHLQAMKAPADLPVIICGMAGSRQGWVEARYLPLPARLLDVIDRAVRAPGTMRDVRILPGLAQHDPARPDVIRGEETQLLGGFAGPDATGLACLPGTHSKWARVDAGQVTEFSTYMTGELFGLMAKESILRHAVGGIDTCDPKDEAFSTAVVEAARHPDALSRLLFSIRGDQLLNARDETSSYCRLSGLLIGGEIAAAHAQFGAASPVQLIASGKLGQLYSSAFQVLDIDIVSSDAEEAVLKGLMAGAQQFWPIANPPLQYGRINA